MIQRKLIVCKDCQEYRYMWAHGRCQFCDGLYRSKKKKAAKKKEKKGAFGFDNQHIMFAFLWNEMDKPRKCPISGKDLDMYMRHYQFTWCFAHILPKGLYPLYKLNPYNIMIVHPDVHTLLDRGTEEERKESGYDFNMFYNRKDELKKTYEIFAKDN